MKILSMYIIYPIYSLPIVISKVLKNKNEGYIYLSLFLGILAFLLIPYDTWDLVRHYHRYELLREKEFASIIESHSELFISIFTKILIQLNIPKEFLPFTFISISYYIFFQILKDIIKSCTNKYNKELKEKTYIILYLFVILNTIRFIDSSSGLRNGLAFSICLLGIYMLYSKRKKLTSFFLLLLACTIHSSIILLVPLIYFCNIRINPRLIKPLILIGLIIITLRLSGNIISGLLEYLKPILISINLWHPSYLSNDGVWGLGYMSNFNEKSIALEFIIKPLPLYLSFIYLSVRKKTKHPKYRNLVYFMIFISSLFSDYRTLFDRYSYFTSILFIFLIFMEYRSMKISFFMKYFFLSLAASLFIISLAHIYKYKETYGPSWIQILYKPLPILMLESTTPNEYIIRNE